MAYPIWLTPAGNLGIVPEAEFYQYELDGYDTSGGILKFSKISGTLPPGLQVTSTGSIQGIPISTGGPDLNQEYTFTVRLQNLSTMLVADRTFNITVTNVAPPIIIPKTIVNYYNLSLQGSISANAGDHITQQFNSANATVFRTVTNSSVITVTYNTERQFDNNNGNLIVSNGGNVTLTNSYPIGYSIVSGIATRDLGEYFDGQIIDLQLEATEFILGGNLTWRLKSGSLPPGLFLNSEGLIHGYINLIPSTGPAGDPGWDDTNWDGRYTVNSDPDWLGWDFPLGTTSKNFEFTIEVSDGSLTDVVTYNMFVVPKQSLTADSSKTTVDADGNVIVNGNIKVITADTTILNGTKLTADVGPKHNPIIISTQDDVLPQRQGSWFTFKVDAIDLDQDVLNYSIPTLSAGAFDEQVILGQFPYISGEVIDGHISVGTVFTNNNTPLLTDGDQIQVLAPYTDISGVSSLLWYNATVNNQGSMRLVGNTIIAVNPGDTITQAIGLADATVISASESIGNITIGGGTIVGTIAVGGNLILSANIGDILTQNGSTGNATVIESVRLNTALAIRFNSGTFILNTGNLRINGANISSYPVSITTSVQNTIISPVIGDIITQPSTGANATVINSQGAFNSNTVAPSTFEVRFNLGKFEIGPTAGNIQLNGSNIDAYPTTVYTQSDIMFAYNTAGVFRINQAPLASTLVYINGNNSFALPGRFLTIGVDVDSVPSTQGTIGLDEDKFDQGALSLPGSLTLNTLSGWITGFLPNQTANETVYEFELIVYKRDYPSYRATRLLNVSILGDLYDTIEWLTPTYLGTIQNGAVSDLSVVAFSSLGKQIYYSYTSGSYINQIQGLTLDPTGLLTGRASFQLFGLDSGQTTFDNDPLTNIPSTTVDHTFEFSITARTFDQSTSSSKVFSILVRERNTRPYENLYLKALLSKQQRAEFRDILQNQSIFPPESIFRSLDPWFGLSQEIRMLYLPGLNPSSLSSYAEAIETNHFQKRLLFTNVKTAVARRDGVYDIIEDVSGSTVGTYNVYTSTFVPSDYSQGYSVSSRIPDGTSVGDQTIKYEVVYAEIKDQNSNSSGEGPADVIDLTNVIRNRYLDGDNSYIIANPNSFTNMDNTVVNSIGYLDKGVLPDWMTSIQLDGTQLGFVRAVVLAYTNPGASNTIAWRFNELGYDLNEINFTVDRYYVDSVYSSNYDTTTGTFITSKETSFDRYPPLPSLFKNVASVDYAVDTPFQEINERTISEINSRGGLDGITTFRNGEKLVFFSQEFQSGININDIYNQGWANSIDPWDDPGSWDYDSSWDPSIYVPGYQEWMLSRQVIDGNSYYATPNQRISIWQINVDTNDYVRLTLANVSLSVVGYTANTTGYGTNVTIKNTNGIFVGMPVKGTNLSNITVITDIVGSNITIYPAATGSLSSTITSIPTPNFNDVIFVKNGTSHGGVNIYYDPVINSGNLVPSWSEIPQQIKTSGTIFDGDGTKFYDYRDSYVTPYQGERQLIFPRQNVFV